MIQPTPQGHTSSVDTRQFQKSELRDMIRIDEREAREYMFHRAKNSQDMHDALKLVQDIYIQEGYVDKRTVTGPCRVLKNHLYEDTAVFVGKKNGDIIFTVSLFPDSPWGLPMDAIYEKELGRLRSRGRQIGEVGCLATHPDHRTGTQIIPMYCNKIILNYAMEQIKLDDLVIAVHPKHAPVYKELLLFDDLNPGTVRAYPSVNNNPAVALRLNLRETREKYRQCYQHKPLEANLHHFVFVKNCSNIDLFDGPRPLSVYGTDNLFFPTSKVP